MTVRGCTGKVRYLTLASAQTVASRVRRRAVRERGTRSPQAKYLHAYACKSCGFYHIGKSFWEQPA